MYKENSTFAQLLQLVDRLGFDNSVKKNFLRQTVSEFYNPDTACCNDFCPTYKTNRITKP